MYVREERTSYRTLGSVMKEQRVRHALALTNASNKKYYISANMDF